MEHDLLIVGAGPAGLSLARALRGSGLRTTLIEQSPLESLQHPAFDGREIALTQHSAALLRQLGLWSLLGEANIAPLKDALVLDGGVGTTQSRMRIGHDLSPKSELGFLVANHHIRRAAFEAAMGDGPGNPPELRCGQQVTSIQTDAQSARLTLGSGETLSARLVVAADSRHSSTRRAMGIAADMHDYGRTMLVCNMTHERPHEETAWEWFDHGQTLALLPMNPDPTSGRPRSSVVLTLPHQAIQPLLGLDEAAFGLEMTRRFGSQLGDMRLVSTRHAYPLVGVWARRFVAQRFAVVGDAAVGMHPVTAHGFNLGLRSIDTLSKALIQAHRSGQDIASPQLLERYQLVHQRAARGLYMATHAVATLYTREHVPARWLRRGMVELGERFTPFKRAVAASLTGLG
ncbi:5-demethoxyubiquinol-8 5-hydroxylase UbiM [Hydrogenophaga flava]|uniref:5-demethoxyubiquinol-8 5-hydroxylase UbiM n=1 Tax=Hydrogenophaga flava TaxID=65657 RepID=UPI00082691A5|nr:5-demethoxyubiquinol-8 5-hydroxylase UbiM [Hydrogenophaga flava]